MCTILKLVKREFELALTYFTKHFKCNKPEALAGLVSLSVISFFIVFFCVFLVLLVYYHFPREKSLFDSHPTIFRHTRTAPSKIKQIQPSWGRVLWLAPSPIAHKSPGGSQAGKSRSSWWSDGGWKTRSHGWELQDELRFFGHRWQYIIFAKMHLTCL